MIVAPETPADAPAVRALLLACFPGPDEADLVEALRADGDVALALVAREGGSVVGHALFSPMAAPCRALALAPLAVAAAHRRRGVGAALVREGLARAAAAGWDAAFVLGDPPYYGRFGFSAAAAAPFASPHAGAHFMALALRPGGLPEGGGAVAHAPAFARLG